MEKGTPQIVVPNAGRKTMEAMARPDPSDCNKSSGGKEAA